MIPAEHTELKKGIRAQFNDGPNVNDITEWITEFIDIKFVSKTKLNRQVTPPRKTKGQWDKIITRALLDDIRCYGGYQQWKESLKNETP